MVSMFHVHTLLLRARTFGAAAALITAGLLVAQPALAEDPAAVVADQGTAVEEDAAESRSEAFRAVEGAVEEDIAGGPLMLAAYAATWVLLFLYVVRLTSLQQRTQRDVERLTSILGSAGSGDKE